MDGLVDVLLLRRAGSRDTVLSTNFARMAASFCEDHAVFVVNICLRIESKFFDAVFPSVQSFSCRARAFDSCCPSWLLVESAPDTAHTYQLRR